MEHLLREEHFKLKLSPWIHGLQPKELNSNVTVLPAPLVSRQSHVSANDKRNSEVKKGVVQTDENSEKSHLGDCLIKAV